ncbi:MobH family relaxase [Alteromonas gracilis]|uniref:MobH family relaxase n=1 Tax=Alteromonas gracilis TaxID=1479524 RepID=UPI003735F0F6
MKLLNAAVGRIAKLINKKGADDKDMSNLTEGYLRRYPVRSFGIPVANVEDILLSYKLEIKKLIPAAAIRINSERPEEPTFNNLYKETIQNLAGYVHLLPASEYHHHHELGGLFYHSLQTAHGCLEKARSREGKIPRDKKSSNIDIFQLIKPKWIYGAWALGLVHDIGKVIMDITVYEHGNETNVWSPLNESLIAWAKRTGVRSYETRMTKDRQHGAHEEVGALLVKEVISKEGIEYIRAGGPMLMNQIYQYMSGKYIDGAFLHQIVKHVDGLETARDINMRWDKHLGESRVNVEKIFISSARSLLPTMKANEPKGKIFVCGGRAFVTVSAIDQIIAFAKQENYKQFPSSTKEFCEALMEAGVVEPIRNQNGEATDEWFGILKPSTGNEYRVVKLVSPIVIYWEGETPRSIPGVYIVGNTGVKEAYSADGTLQFNTGKDTDGIGNSDGKEKQVLEKGADNSEKQNTEKNINIKTSASAVAKNDKPDIPTMSDAEMASHLDAMEMYVDDEDDSLAYEHNTPVQHETECAEKDIPRPKTKKPTLIKTDKKATLPPPKLETYETEIEGKEADCKQQTLDEKNSPKRNNKAINLKESASADKKEKQKNITERKRNNQRKKNVAEDQKLGDETDKQETSHKIPRATTVQNGTNKPKRKRFNQTEDKVSKFLSEELNQKMSNGDVAYIDGTFALSVDAITEMSNTDYMQALPQLKARNIISDERGIRKIVVMGNEQIMVVLNKGLVERIADEKSIDMESIAIIERENPTIKDKNNRKNDLIAKSRVAENKDDYASQVMQLLENSEAVIEERDGIYVEFNHVNNITRRFSKENQQLLQAAITKYHEIEKEDKTYIRILEKCDER